MGGDFTKVFRQTGGGTFLSFADGEAVPQTPIIEGEVKAAVPDGQGGWFLGGNFTKVAGVSCLNLVHILPNKTVDPMFLPNPNSHVNALLIDEGFLYVAGDFTNISATGRNRLARFDALNGTIDPNWNPDVDGPVYAMAMNQDTLFIGGSFSLVGSVRAARNNLAAVDADPTPGTTGAPTAWNPNVNNSVNALALSFDGDVIFAGGSFNFVNGSESRNLLAAINTSTGNTEAWDAGATGTSVFALTLGSEGERLFVGGLFTAIGGETRNNLALLHTKVNFNNSIGILPDTNGAVKAIAQVDDHVFIGGEFNGPGSIGSYERNHLAEFNLFDDDISTTFDPNVYSGGARFGTSVNVITATGTTLFAGGTFEKINTAERKRLAAVNLEEYSSDWKELIVA